MASPTPPLRHARGHVRAPNKDHLIALSHERHGRRLRALRQLIGAFPATWDNRTHGWVGPIKDQGQCGYMPGSDEVLTEDGWVKWEDYDYQAPLGTMNPLTGFLEFQTPLQRHVYDYDGPLYYTNHRSLDFALTPNHRMYVRKWNEGQRALDRHYQFVEIGKLGWYAGLPHAPRGWLGPQLDKLTLGRRSFRGDDFLALVALVLSDGWAGGSESTRNCVSFCCFREDRLDKVRALAQRFGFREVPSRPGVWNTSDADLARWCL